MDSTFYLDNLISQCDDLGMFREEILPKMPDMRQRWMNVIRQILDERGYSKTELAALCGVSRPAVAKWCSGALPSNREDYLRIGFAAGYDYNEMNFFLQRFGRYPGLYAKSLEDSVCIFVLTSENQELLTGILRGEWGFQGMVTTDWWTNGEHYLEAKAGNDLKMGAGFPERVREAYDRGLISKDEIRADARRILATILKFE